MPRVCRPRRYSTSSPCEYLDLIEHSPKPCVFIGKPCDVAAVSALRKTRPLLDAKLGLVLSFFCAGVPSAQAARDFLERNKVARHDIHAVRYRGNGWPGGFSVANTQGATISFTPYLESWDFLQKYRPFRCKLCPDGLGALSDITCGDAWHRYDHTQHENPGLSLMLTRTARGRDLLAKACAAGYLFREPSSAQAVIKAQGLVQRRQEIFGRLLAMRLLRIPMTRFQGFQLYKSWAGIPFKVQCTSILGTLRRLLRDGRWHKHAP